MQLPKFYTLRQTFSQEHIEDVAAELTDRLEDAGLKEVVHPGERVAITVGSRGINNITLLVKTLVMKLKEIGCKPFIVPAMGSHGGAIAQGQVEVLESLGITPDSVGAPILSDMDVIDLGKLESGATVYLDKHAWQADAIIVMNRVKPHTKLKAENESGLMKMMSVGLGKHKGCSQVHSYGLFPTMIEAARVILEKAPIRLGIGIIENGYEETAKIAVFKKEEFERKDAELLKLAKSLMPKFPVDDIDLLVVQEMGKNISGTGIDVNLIGRVNCSIMNENELPRIKRIVAMDLTEATHGNALGMGLVDIAPMRFKDKIDFSATYANVLAVGATDRGKMPVIVQSDREAIDSALRSIGNQEYSAARIVIVKNTLALDTIIVSENILREISHYSNVQIIRKEYELEFDGENNLILCWQ